MGDVGSRKGSPRAYRYGLTKESVQRLSELGRSLPPPTPDVEASYAAEWRSVRNRRLIVGFVVTVLVVVVAGVGLQLLRPLPGAAFQPVPRSIRLPGAAPSLPWPSQGAAALGVEGIGSLGQAGSTQPLPMGGLAHVLVSFVILHDHPLSTRGDGPSIAVTPQVLSSYRAGSAFQVAEVPVTSGESLTERQALEGLLVDSGDDMADLLAVWDAGSTHAFVTKMNDAARILGLRSTHIADPSGLDTATVSSPRDLVALGEIMLAVPAFAQIVALGETTLPHAPRAFSLNFDLGQDGIIGIEAATGPGAQGCYLFAARQVVDGRSVTVVGAVLGQSGVSDNTAAVDAGDLLVKAAFASLSVFPVVAPGQVVGKLVTQWGASSPVTATAAMTVLGWPGLTVSFAPSLADLHGSVPKGARAGTITIREGGDPAGVTMRTTHEVAGPSPFWRLTNF